MRAAWAYTLACAVLAMLNAGLIPLAHGWQRPLAALAALACAAGARGGMCAIEVATRPPTSFSNHQPERRPL